MGEHNGVVGGVSAIVAQEFKPWWEGIAGTVDVQHVDGTELSPREAFNRVLNWQVLERDLMIDIATGDEPVKLAIVPNKKALIREDNRAVLGIHSGGYGVLQNEVLCEFVELIKIVGSDVQIKSAGELFGGPVVWMLAKLGEDKHFIGHDERIAKYFAVSSSHDGSLVFTARPTDTRIECMNTFAMHLDDKAVITIRHTAKADERIAEAKRTVDALYAHSAELDAEIELLLSTPFTSADYKDVIVPALNPKPAPDTEWAKLSPRKESNWLARTDALVAAYYRDDAANIVGTAWGAVMGVNSYELWEQRVKRGSRSENQAVKALKGTFPLTQAARAMVLR